MSIKTHAKRILAKAGQQPTIARVLALPVVRAVARRLPGASHLIANSWDRRHPFDVSHGTDTSGFIRTSDLGLSANDPARAHAGPYGGSQPSVLRAALAALPPLDSFTFVDLGCGKARPLLVASAFPFREIVGVELSAPLAEVGRRNAEIFSQSHRVAPGAPKLPPMRIAVGDASAFPMPAGNVVLFLYNPFGDELIAKVVTAVEAAIAAEPRCIYVVYYNPVGGHCFDASPVLRRRFARMIPYAAEELGFGPDESDPVVIWQGGAAPAPTDHGANARISVVIPKIRTMIEAV